MKHISSRDNKKYIFILEPAEDQVAENPEYYIARKNEIETGILDIENIEVTEGISEGDLILIGRIPGVEDGTEVKLTDEDLSKKDEGQD